MVLTAKATDLNNHLSNRKTSKTIGSGGNVPLSIFEKAANLWFLVFGLVTVHVIIGSLTLYITEALFEMVNSFVTVTIELADAKLVLEYVRAL